MAKTVKNFVSRSEESRTNQDLHYPRSSKSVELGMLYSSSQREQMIRGKQKRNAMVKAADEAASRAKKLNELRGNFRVDTLLYGSPGIGKTFTIKRALKESGIKYIEIKGDITMYAFGGNLMVAHHRFMRDRKSPEEKLVILIDDCDSFFVSQEDRNILKGMTGENGSREFQYNKHVQDHMLTPEQLQILSQYLSPNGAHGFRVNCDDIIFIITTNFKFPTENQANAEANRGSSSRAAKLMDLAAIQRRFTTGNFILDKETNWGWIATVCLEDGLLNELDNDFQKYILLEWVSNNWWNMREHNLDTVRDMMYLMIEKPDSYKDEWEANFLDADRLETERRR